MQMVDFVNGGSIVTVSSKGPKLKGWRAESGDGIFQFILEWRQRAPLPTSSAVWRNTVRSFSRIR